MKSAYELAMERLEKQSPTQKLTAEQKAAIAEIDATVRAKVAEREVFLRGELEKARASGDETEAGRIEEQLARDLRRLHEDGEAKKAKIRGG